ncbi:PadR family transcriptional regulator [Luteimicrobium subarcticum]|uniref:PadR family transcriptional regulator n=1 Tax=Luteimicrobium subarcticum TaxID=620910 RepID=A0A2M8WUT0_9MICO|nr:PadR family transcriptional regulator [Luteimicrobium subarcticum]PJI94683.1 PadR family transcriptional regulator [Luteimicrobium subarcticum]
MMAPRELSTMALVVLGLLREGPKHPYELLRIMRKHHDDLRMPVSVGSIYHAVERLERTALAAPVATEREGARPERTTYAITDAGRAAHTQRTRHLLSTLAREYPAFDVGLSQADALAADDVAALLRERLSTVEDERAGMAAVLDSTVARGVPRRYLLDAFYELELRGAQIAWLRRTVAEIESGDLDWSAVPPGTTDPHIHPVALPATTPTKDHA